jgi:tripartite-type tricarboxylate transporter receptor subunit TctC
MSTTPTRRAIFQLSLLTLSLAMGGPVWAQAAKWPSKPIKIVVAFPPGGLTDAYARNFGEYLSTKLGVPVVIENKPGAGAIIGIDAVAKAPADGYTLSMSTSGTYWQNRILYSKLPYNLDKDLTPVTVFPSGPLVVGIHDKIPAKNMAEFVAWAKKNPASMGTYAPGSYRTWWPTRPTASTARRSSRCTTRAKPPCGWTWLLASRKLPWAAFRLSTPWPAGACAPLA